ncbi:class I SAM-dependent methyltransferase [Candidatus Gracilibacteria bacterium]|nr:class I SAM-dependent methyltransferase [Candidatus Gracilibacteria bacterium]MCF7898482.1 class I SAM-dependent methyltransferase [Candidatus Paceibacterota bacterium]
MSIINFLKNKKRPNYFAEAPEFISIDNRERRTYNPISFEQMTKKHEALFSDDFVKDKTILDLGCGLGATGHWCLSAGASKYVGVETQKEYADPGNQLLEKYHKNKGVIILSGVEEFLKNNEDDFDIVCAMGVLYVFTDYYSILSEITKITKNSLVVDNPYHNLIKLGYDFCGVEYRNNHSVNLANQDASLLGRASILSPKGLTFIMGDFGFETSGVIYPEKILSSHDAYNFELSSSDPMKAKRYFMIFNRSNYRKSSSLSQDLNAEKIGPRRSW